MLRILASAALLVAAPAEAAERLPTAGKIAASAPFKAAQAALDSGYDLFIEELVALTEIPAPPFKESARAAVYAEHFRKLGLRDVAIDPEGNVTGLRPGTDPGLPLILLSAHLDTVFPEGTNVKVRREGSRLSAPGIGDDTRGLATLLAYVRAIDAARIRTRRSILFVATVGEEGLGDLRGARYLFTRSAYRDKIGAFVSLDGDDPARVIDRAVGSRRYRVTFKGPGGHSYGAFGIVNPMAAMANAVSELYRINLPAVPKTTFSASVTGGGTSVNAIPSEVFVEVDMRSEDKAALADLDRRFLAILQASVDGENATRSTRAGKVGFDARLLGERPAGATPADAPILRAVDGAIEAVGLKPRHEAASTDANIAMSLGVPAVTIGYRGVGGRAHSLDEFVDVARPEGVRGMSVGLLAALAAAEMELR